MRKTYTVFIVLFLATLGARAQNSIITDISYPYLDKLITAAKTHYPRVNAFQDRVELAKANVSRAALSWFDIFTFSYIYQPNNTLNYTIPSSTTANNRYLFNGLQLGVSLNLGSVLAKPAGVKAAKADLKISADEQSEYLITLTADVKRRYFTYLLQQNLVKTQTQAYDDIQTGLKQSKYKFQKGELSFEAYNAALVTVATRTEQKMQAEANFFIAKSELEALIGAKLEDIK